MRAVGKRARRTAPRPDARYSLVRRRAPEAGARDRRSGRRQRSAVPVGQRGRGPAWRRTSRWPSVWLPLCSTTRRRCRSLCGRPWFERPGSCRPHSACRVPRHRRGHAQRPLRPMHERGSTGKRPAPLRHGARGRNGAAMRRRSLAQERQRPTTTSTRTERVATCEKSRRRRGKVDST